MKIYLLFFIPIFITNKNSFIKINLPDNSIYSYINDDLNIFKFGSSFSHSFFINKNLTFDNTTYFKNLTCAYLNSFTEIGYLHNFNIAFNNEYFLNNIQLLTINNKNIVYDGVFSLNSLINNIDGNVIAFTSANNSKYFYIGEINNLKESFISNQSTIFSIINNNFYIEYLVIADSISNIKDNNYEYYIQNTYLNLIFEPLINYNILPAKYKPFIFNNLLEDEQNQCKYTNKTSNISEMFDELKLFVIKCKRESIKIKEKEIMLSTMNQGLVIKFNDKLLIKEGDYVYIPFYFSENESNNNIILGTEIMFKYNTIIFNKGDIINIYGSNDQIIDTSKYIFINKTRIKKSYLFFSILIILVIIFFAIIVPIFCFWRNKRKMMDRLNYEVIYQKVKNTKEELLKEKTDIYI